MKDKYIPKTKLGKFSVWLMLAYVILFFIGPLSVNLLYREIPAGDSILADFSGRPVFTIFMFVAFASAMTAMITGLISVIKQKEHSPLVYAAVLIGLFLTIFLIGEIVIPH